jgi:hypothetical protein
MILYQFCIVLSQWFLQMGWILILMPIGAAILGRGIGILLDKYVK